MDVVIDDNNGTLTKYQNGPGIDNKLKQTTSGTSKYFLQNHLGSTVALTDSSGGVTDSNSYDSFGNATNASFPSRYQYTGREYDATTGLQYSPHVGTTRISAGLFLRIRSAFGEGTLTYMVMLGMSLSDVKIHMDSIYLLLRMDQLAIIRSGTPH